MFPGKGFAYNVISGHSYKKDVIRYHIPFTGDAQILRCKPTLWILRTVEVSIDDNNVCFDIVNFYNDPEKIQQLANEKLSVLQGQLKNVRNQINGFNSSLQEKLLVFTKTENNTYLSRMIYFLL